MNSDDLAARGVCDWITQDELARLFPHGLPIVAVKLLFPEKSEPLNTAEVYAVLVALSGDAALAAASPALTPAEQALLDQSMAMRDVAGKIAKEQME